MASGEIELEEVTGSSLLQKVIEGVGNEIAPGNQEIIIDGMPLQIPAGNYRTEVLEDGTVQVIVYQDQAQQNSSESAIQTDIDIKNKRAHNIGIQNTTVPHFNSYSFSEVGIQTDFSPVIEEETTVDGITVHPEDEDTPEGADSLSPGKRTKPNLKGAKVIQNIQEQPDSTQVRGMRAGKEVMFHKCGICGKIYKNKSNWMNHLKTHSGEQVFMCGYCGQIFQRSTFITHVKGHQEEEEAKQEAKRLQLDKINQAATSKVGETDIVLGGEDGEKRYMVRSHQVTLPNQQVATVIDLGNLIDVAMNAEVSSEGKPPEKENTENVQTSKPPEETEEAPASRPEAEGEEIKTKYIYKCNVCGKEYNNKSNCHRHLKTHTHEKAYKCDQCDKYYMHRYELKMHSRIHTGEKPYKCPICTRAFNESGNLRRHMKIHAGDDTPYKCGVCFKGFTDIYRLHVHLKVHSGKIVCDTCGKSFGKISDLYRHIRIHTGDKPYKCDMCPKSFCQKVNLQTHYRTHTGKSPYVCTICNFTFSRKQILDKHMRGHEEEEEELRLKIKQEHIENGGEEEEEGDVDGDEEDEEGMPKKKRKFQYVEVDIDGKTGLVEVPTESQETETGLTQEEIAQLVAATVTTVDDGVEQGELTEEMLVEGTVENSMEVTITAKQLEALTGQSEDVNTEQLQVNNVQTVSEEVVTETVVQEEATQDVNKELVIEALEEEVVNQTTDNSESKTD